MAIPTLGHFLRKVCMVVIIDTATGSTEAYGGLMRPKIGLQVLVLAILAAFWTTSAHAATKVHEIAFGRWLSAQWLARDAGDKPVTIKVRALLVDGRVKEYVMGSPHDVTERLFVVRRAFRLNDSLPDDSGIRWQWERGGWLMVDRLTGRVSAINLPEFDPYHSAASWYRDYVAYCGVADDGKKAYAVVMQLSRRKPILKKPVLDAVPDNLPPDSVCSAPSWQRNPMRVTFAPSGNLSQAFSIRGHAVDVVTDSEEED